MGEGGRGGSRVVSVCARLCVCVCVCVCVRERERERIDWHLLFFVVERGWSCNRRFLSAVFSFL